MRNVSPHQFVNNLKSINLPNVFNPYRDRCPTYDRYNAALTRRTTLLKLLELASLTRIESIWLGRDLGYRGGRRTGLALTDDNRAAEHAARWNLQLTCPTKGNPIRERTADTIWQLLSLIDEPIFLWNVFPLHPHCADKPFTNRSHTAYERGVGEVILKDLIEILQPECIVAIGQHANQTAQRIGFTSDILAVRHPSYGGQVAFVNAIEQRYGLQD